MVAMAVGKLTPERRREMTREALIEAAAGVFARRGFHGASLDEIAETAGFTRGAIYSNFGGKEDLMLAVVERYNRMHLEAMAAAQEGEDPDARLRGASAAAVWRELVSRDPNIVPLLLEFRLYALRNPEFRPRLAALTRQQTAAVADLIRREAAAIGVALPLPPEDLADLMSSAVSGLSELAAIDAEHKARYDELAERFFVMMAEWVLSLGAERVSEKPPRRDKNRRSASAPTSSGSPASSK